MCHVEKLRLPGSNVTVEIAGHPVAVVRDRDGHLSSTPRHGWQGETTDKYPADSALPPRLGSRRRADQRHVNTTVSQVIGSRGSCNFTYVSARWPLLDGKSFTVRNDISVCKMRLAVKQLFQASPLGAVSIAG